MPCGTLISVRAYKHRRSDPMMKISLAVAAIAAALTAVPIVTQVKAQIDMKTGRHLDERDPTAFYRERRPRYDATVGVGGGATIVRPQDHASGAPLRPKGRTTKR
jgi:hypothetical protein